MIIQYHWDKFILIIKTNNIFRFNMLKLSFWLFRFFITRILKCLIDCVFTFTINSHNSLLIEVIHYNKMVSFYVITLNTLHYFTLSYCILVYTLGFFWLFYPNLFLIILGYSTLNYFKLFYIRLFMIILEYIKLFLIILVYSTISYLKLISTIWHWNCFTLKSCYVITFQKQICSNLYLHYRHIHLWKIFKNELSNSHTNDQCLNIKVKFLI